MNVPSFRCSHFGPCAGCSSPLSVVPPVWQEVLSFLGPTVFPRLHQGSPIHWRHRAKVAVRGTPDQPLLGLFKRSSHDVLPIPFCLVHHPHLNQAFEMVRRWIQQHQLLPYEEKAQRGELRYLQGVVQRQTGHVQLSFVVNVKPDSPQAQRWHALIQELGEKHPQFWHSLHLNFNDRLTNTIFGPQWSHVWGEEWLWEKVEGTWICYGPSNFGQANLPLFERLLRRLRQILPEKARVAEFYAGVGVIGLCLASQCTWVKCSEIHPHAEAFFQRARMRLAPSHASRLSFFSGSTQEALHLLEDANTVIVDPPRKGLDPLFFCALKEALSVRQLIYISCGWEAFKHDCQRLSLEGWSLQSVDGYLFFPGSHHVELLANFERKLP